MTTTTTMSEEAPGRPYRRRRHEIHRSAIRFFLPFTFFWLNSNHIFFGTDDYDSDRFFTKQVHFFFKTVMDDFFLSYLSLLMITIVGVFPVFLSLLNQVVVDLFFNPRHQRVSLSIWSEKRSWDLGWILIRWFDYINKMKWVWIIFGGFRIGLNEWYYWWMSFYWVLLGFYRVWLRIGIWISWVLLVMNEF